jgi:hypothetical protein
MSKPIDHSFFREEWDDEVPTQEMGPQTASHDSTHEQDPESARALAAYEAMKEGSQSNAVLRELFQEVQESIARYLIAIARLNEIQSREKRGETISRYEIQGTDLARRSSHNGLIDHINVLSRAFAKYGLDNEWRKVVGLSAREEVTRWAIRIGSTVAADRTDKPHKTS